MFSIRFCKVLDSPKTGWKVKPETIKGDKREYYHPRGPQWKAAEKKKKDRGSKIDTTNLPYLQRRKDSPYVHGEFVMDILRIMVKKETDGLLADVEALFSKFRVEDDDNLAAPWNNAVAWAERGDDPGTIRSKRKDLAVISQHVQHMFKTHGRMLRGVGKHSSFTERSISDRQDVLRALSLEFSVSPKLEDLPTIIDEDTLSRLRASYAYIYDREQCSEKEGWSRFPWNMATRELCTIKAKALGPYKTVTNDFYQQLRLKTGWSHRPLLVSITDAKDS
jgi:RNA-dependent RNA polymerase